MPLNPGDLLFVGWDSDNEDIAFITTVDLTAGDIIYFTDDEWDGTAFFGTEQLMEWTVPAGGIDAGTIVNIDMDPDDQTVTFDSGGAVDYIRGGFQIAQGNEMFWAFQGTRTGNTVTPTDFIAVIGNEADGNDNQTPNLTGTGLTFDNGAFVIDGDEDYMEWTADDGLPDPVTRDDLIASILDTDNWTTADGGGNNNPNGTGFAVDTQTVVCFARGTELDTAESGAQKVEDLRVGTRVVTHPSGAKPVRWICRRAISAEELAKKPKLRPVRITAGALGPNCPTRDLLVSRQHRILLRSKIAFRMFGTKEVLIPAIKLTELAGIYIDEIVETVEYFHIMFDCHEIVFSEGTPTESLFTGTEALKALSPGAHEEILTLFPEIEQSIPGMRPAAFIPPEHRQKRLVARHVKNAQPLRD